MSNVPGKSWFKINAGKLLKDYSYLLSFALLLIVGYINNDSFFNWRNITNIFVQSGTSSGIIAFGMTMVICAGMIDISVGAQVAIVSGMSIDIFNDLITRFPALDGGLGIVSMLAFCLVFGLLIGTFNGLLVAKGHVPAMIATLAVQTACRSLINYVGKLGPFSVANGNSQTAFYQTFRLVAAGSIDVFGYKIPYPMLMFIATGLLFGLIMQRTKLGKHIYAVGSNETSARLAGVNVDRVKIAVFAITGILCGLTAWIYGSRVMAVSANTTGNLFEMDAIAAVAIGGTAMSGGRGKVIGTFLGVLMFKIINNILAGRMDPFLIGAISGVIIIIAALLQNVQGIRKQRR